MCRNRGFSVIAPVSSGHCSHCGKELRADGIIDYRSVGSPGPYGIARSTDTEYILLCSSCAKDRRRVGKAVVLSALGILLAFLLAGFFSQF